MWINKNLRFLRTRQGLTQKQFAEKLGLKQSVIGAYEEARATPPLIALIDIAAKLEVSIDMLAKCDLEAVPEDSWQKEFVRGRDVLAISVDAHDRENVELVSQKASAGYLNGYQDPEFIRDLPKINLPVLPRNATYRAFELKGDSMLPIQPGSIVFGAYIDDLKQVKSGQLYVLVTRDEGIVFKRVYNQLDTHRQLLLVSDNRDYQPYTVDIEAVLEIWSAKGYFSTKFPELVNDHPSVSVDQMAMQIVALQEELQQLRKK